MHRAQGSALRNAVYNKCEEQWLREIEIQENELADFEADYERFRGTPEAQREIGPHPEEDMRELRERLAEDRMDMCEDLGEIDTMDRNALRHRMEWAITEDKLNAQLPDPDEDPVWWVDRRGEIAGGQVLLSGMTWRETGMPPPGPVNTGANRRGYGPSSGSQRQIGHGRDGSRFRSGPTTNTRASRRVDAQSSGSQRQIGDGQYGSRFRPSPNSSERPPFPG